MSRSIKFNDNTYLDSKGVDYSDNMRKPNEMVFFNIGHTAPGSRCPIRLLTKVLAVEERAMTVMKVKDEMLRMMLVAAKERSPRCSTPKKKRNQVLRERKFCNMTQQPTSNTLPNNFMRKRGRRWKP